MKQNRILIKLLAFCESDHPFGNKQGREVLLKLSDYIDHHTSDIYEISLDGIVATDASFPRESVISLAKMHNAEKGFYLTGKFSKDLLDNWNYAAIAKEQPLIVKERVGYRVIGPEPKAGAKELLDFVM